MLDNFTVRAARAAANSKDIVNLIGNVKLKKPIALSHGALYLVTSCSGPGYFLI
jgi:hypothetical protein